MLRAVMDAINDDTLLPALAIEMKRACHCPGRENGSAKCAMRLRRPDSPGEAEEKKFMWARTTATRIVGILSSPNKGWGSCKRWRDSRTRRWTRVAGVRTSRAAKDSP